MSLRLLQNVFKLFKNNIMKTAQARTRANPEISQVSIPSKHFRTFYNLIPRHNYKTIIQPTQPDSNLDKLVDLHLKQ